MSPPLQPPVDLSLSLSPRALTCLRISLSVVDVTSVVARCARSFTSRSSSGYGGSCGGAAASAAAAAALAGSSAAALGVGVDVTTDAPDEEDATGLSAVGSIASVELKEGGGGAEAEEEEKEQTKLEVRQKKDLLFFSDSSVTLPSVRQIRADRLVFLWLIY